MNCKPGDLAIIIKSEMPENIGRIVRVVEPYPAADNGWPRWAVDAEGMPLLGYDRCVDRIIETAEGCIEDAFLRPISGAPVDEEMRDEVTA